MPPLRTLFDMIVRTQANDTQAIEVLVKAQYA
jgi:hypothetical protein